MRLTRTRGIAAGIALTVGLVLAGCTGGGGDDGGGGEATTLTLGSTFVPTSWDPAQVGDANAIPYAQAAYDTLILRDSDGEYVPMLASEWTVSEDNRTISFTLRDDVTFSDDAKFDAEAVKANIEHFAAGNGPNASQLAGLEGVEVVDATHVDVTFTEPNPNIIFVFSHSAGRIASPAALEGDGLATVPVGSGPYVLDESATVQGSTYTFTPREGYWNPELQKYDKVVYQVFPDETGLLNALKSGQVDSGNLSVQDNVANAEASGLEVLHPEYHISWAGLILFDRTGAIVPELADVRVRQAIALAFDRKAILDAVYNGNGVINEQIFNEGSEAYDTALNDAYPYDPAAAKALLAEAGVSGFSLTMPLVAGFMTPAVQTAITQQLGEIGITVNFENVEGASFITDLLSGKYAATYMFLGAVPTDWTVVQNYITPTSAWNPLGATDPELQALIDAIPAQTEEERVESFAAINEFIVDQAWFVPWIWVEENFATQPGLNVVLQPQQNVPYLYNYTP